MVNNSHKPLINVSISRDVYLAVASSVPSCSMCPFVPGTTILELDSIRSIIRVKPHTLDSGHDAPQFSSAPTTSVLDLDSHQIKSKM